MDSKLNNDEAGSRRFPWGVCVGELCRLGSDGQTISRNLLIPSLAGGMMVQYDESNEQNAVAILETAALSFIDVLPHKAAEVHVVDFDHEKKFQWLTKLAPLRQYRLYSSKEAAENFFKVVSEMVHERNHDLLDDEIATLSEFNMQGSAFEKYQVLLVDLNEYPRNDDEREKILNIVKAAYRAGFFFIFYINIDVAELKKNQDNLLRFLEILAMRIPQISLTQSDAGYSYSLSPHPLTNELLQRIASQKYVLDVPKVELTKVIENRIDLDKSVESKLNDFLEVAVGKTSKGKDIVLRLGEKSGCNAAFMGGMPGFGKTTLLNRLIMGIAEKYSSDELRLFLMDYKNGTEFQIFKNHPNCEKIFLDNSDMQAAKDLLISFSRIMEKRGKLFTQHEIRDINSWNEKALMANSGKKIIPRYLLIVDECQKFFEGANRSYFMSLLNDICKRGRAFGIHIFLTTQILTNVDMDRGLLGLIGLRITFKLNNSSECDRILSFNNHAPINFTVHEFVLNSDSGNKEANERGKNLDYLTFDEIAKRLAEIRKNKGEENCLTPEIAKRNDVINDTEPKKTVNNLTVNNLEQSKLLETLMAKKKSQELENEKDKARIAKANSL